MVVSALSSNFGLIGFTVLEMERFSYFGNLAWNCLFTPTSRGFWGRLLLWPPKRHLLVWKHVVWAIKHKIRSNSLTWVLPEKKRQDRTVKKVTKALYFTYLAEAPTEPIFLEICTVVAVHDLITCANFWTEIFRGYSFTGGWISHFSIDSFMGLTTVQR